MPEFARFTDLVRSLPATVPFVGPETQEHERGRPFRARLGANESAFGPSPAVVEAMTNAAPEAWKYGDARNIELRTALARHLGTEADTIMPGEGVDGLLGLLVRMIVEPGTPVVTSKGAYPTFDYHVAGFGGRFVRVDYRDDREDPEALSRAVRESGAPLVYFSNPDNPMGSWWDAETVTAFARGLPDMTMLLLDEAYGEMAPPGTLPPVEALIDRPNVVRMRTFSKAYGLAGMRIGYAFGAKETIAAFDKVRNHFGMTKLSQIAAVEALKDQAHLDTVLGEIETARRRISDIARQNGLTPLPSATNFVAIDCGRDGDYARAVLGELVARDVFVRMPSVAPLDRCIRVSAAPEAELAVFEAELPAALSAAAAVSRPA
ncbi:pyridoxal phosphate-dependent aminotransferase [Pararhizobium mangrovi]|uniref:Pyridoxal phosphate-dependent aminotransferase n=1 Tax=Pararhizobium mangrovi TaxID=2590452 RepID=A0A506UB76_9HYPH|nr:pyridoxal phosphate-dependent aminotransferase [Pararhizobium mangrovi]TPW29869.1 pyridoxal phosphate-dependent aminotransferase [Pararhizobium mangrovi]